VTGILILAGVLGAVVGSFLNVVAWRLPRGESIVHPRSRCPKCEAPVRAHQNIPVVSWLALRGRCAACSTRISARYPLVEALTAALYVGVVAATGADRDAVVGLVLVSALVAISLIDLDHRIIPNRITGPTAVAGVALLAALDPSALPGHLLAGAIAGGAFLAVVLARPGGMGMGDVKLAALLGLFLGSAVAPALFVALAVGAATGVVVAARRGVAVARKTAIPFGPFLALGGVFGILAGSQMVSWYLGTFA
jgi:leader peptidase (prepilin peptidase)/N-methyltransferase